MLPDIERTIVALASGARPSQRAIVRLAGPQTRDILCQLLDHQDLAMVHAARRLTRFSVRVMLNSIDRQLPMQLLYWPDMRSYTGQPAAELHLIGCLPLAEALVDRLCQLGARPAERGEFTLRAFLAGKLDLAQAEAVLGVIEADSPDTLHIALTQLGGNLAPAVQPLRSTIIHIVAELEAGLDFVDEDIEFITRHSVIAQLSQVQAELVQFAARLNTRSSSDVAPRVVLVGLPNSGKSSLFNVLCQTELAIVADLPGTTRDYLQRRIQAGGVELELIDTAGWEQLSGVSPRALAQNKLLECIATADLCLLCVDGSQPCDYERLQTALECVGGGSENWIRVATKMDLAGAHTTGFAWPNHSPMLHAALCDASIGTSSRTAQGIEVLKHEIACTLARSKKTTGPLAIVHQTAIRCRAALAEAQLGIDEALTLAHEQGGEELIAGELRLVLDALATIIGEVHSDDILGEIFSRFCIGK